MNKKVSPGGHRSVSLRGQFCSSGQLWARWTVIDEGGKAPLNVKESRLTRPATEKTTDASVAALSETVADLSREIANMIVTADGQRKP
jgi:hypothetical protein